jgi:dipeptidyl aminopeptidase/acylaminoacyl peptidase
MNLHRLGLFLVLAPLGSAGTAAELPGPEIFGRLPAVADVEISPDGRTLATLQNFGGDTGVIFYDLDDPGAKPAGMRLENAAARHLTWANDDTVLLMVSQSGKRETVSRRETLQAWRWLAVSRHTLQAKVMFGNEPGVYILSPGSLLATLPEDPNRIVVSRWTTRVGAQGPAPMGTGSRLKHKHDSGGVSLFSVQVDDVAASIAAKGNAFTEYWVVDQAGEPVARVDLATPVVNAATGRTIGSTFERWIYARSAGSDDLKLVRTMLEPEVGSATIELVGLSALSERMLATVIVDDKRAVIEFDMDTGENGPLVYRDEVHDIDSVMYDARTARVTGVRITDDLPREVYFDPEEQRLQEMLARALPGSMPALWSHSVDKNRYVVKAIYTDRPARWHLFDKAARELSPVGSTYPALDDRVVAAKERHDFTASDGLLIRGYLTIPAGASRTGLPLIVLPHGGPWARDDQSFDWWAFFYAARGYLVYQPNFRGSDGYGAAFRRAGDGEWGRRMQQDITEGVESLISSGMVDRSRVCIVGGSYGGYAALAGATLTPDLYACAVSVNGVSSVGDLIGSRAGPSREFWEARIGRLADRSALHRVSPAHNAKNVKAAVLLIHAKDDTVVPVGQSRHMAKALALNRTPHELVELAGEDHWLSAGDTRTEMLRRSIEFIDRHIGGRERE